MNATGESPDIPALADASLVMVDLLDALASYRAGTDSDTIDWISVCLLRISGEETLPTALRLLASELYEETCLRAGALSGHSLSLLSGIIH